MAGAPHGNGPTDALDLADSLRELAAFLRDDLKHESLFRGWWRGGELAGENSVPANPIIRALKAILRNSAYRRVPPLPDIALPPPLDTS